MYALKGKVIRLANRPSNHVRAEDFEIITEQVPEVRSGQVLVKNLFVSLDAGMRLRMIDLKMPVPLYAVREPMYGDAIGEVIDSADGGLKPGDIVRHPLGWRKYALAEGNLFRKIDPDLFPTLSTHLSLGLTSYVGMLEIANLKPGDTVFVSNAASSVGSLAGQIARLKGAKRVIGSVGSPAKADYLVHELGFDAALDYHDRSFREQLRQAAPNGIDVYFDNVGGMQLEAAIDVMNPLGRIVLCGSAGSPEGGFDGVANLSLAIGKRLTLKGFVVTDHLDRAPSFNAEFSQWLRAGAIKYKEMVIQGIEHAPQAFIDLLAGKYLGKVVVKI
ncbi:NADP-dependent oxidoreductase [Paenibacillus hamazuiensis]|uniref:NADP-dependent oxidoreductase n=1 Tax=Paenibacillus hamazuiensis TaxID=2936508 RepID=UPI00200E154D|nr:NADP-dependent oxidoreductase [Paenibacillus hamazuiensis]